MTLSSAGNIIIPSAPVPSVVATINDPAILGASTVILTCSTANTVSPFAANIIAGSLRPGAVDIVIARAGGEPLSERDQCTVNYMIIN